MSETLTQQDVETRPEVIYREPGDDEKAIVDHRSVD